MQKIAKKFVEVMRECSHVAKNGTNDFHKYKYATASDVLEKVNAALTKHGIASVVTPSLLSMQEITTAKGNTERLATVEVTVTLIDSESGESLTLKGLGSGQDLSDKSVAKAQTMALKYCYLNSLAIATSDDPEADRHTDEVMQPPAPKIILLMLLLATIAIVSFLKRLPITLKQNSADFSASIVNVQKNL